MNLVVHKSRIWLIRIGKMIPFVICFIVLMSYTECVYALITENYIEMDGFVILNKPISWLIGEYFRYNIPTLIIITIISYAFETCVWNKLALAYLAFQLFEKQYFASIEIECEYIYAISASNIAVSAFLVYKGIKKVK